MENKILKLVSFGSLLLISNFVQAGMVDLSNWTAEGEGTWLVKGVNNDSVVQTENSEPTVFFDAGTNAINTSISGAIEVKTNNDDDFIGFVLGYQSGELYSTSTDYWLIDWKKGNQSWGGFTGYKGLSLSHVTDGGDYNSFWGHQDGVTEVARANNLGNTGWLSNTAYTFDIVYTANLIEVRVNDLLELSVTASQAGVNQFNDGAYGFYNYSQDSVTYTGIESTTTSVPEPATFGLLSLTLLGLIRFRRNS